MDSQLSIWGIMFSTRSLYLILSEISSGGGTYKLKVICWDNSEIQINKIFRFKKTKQVVIGLQWVIYMEFAPVTNFDWKPYVVKWYFRPSVCPPLLWS